MGARDCSFTVKGKTREALEKNFWKTVKQAKHEHGDCGYTGSAAEFYHLVWTTKVFNTREEMQDFIAGLRDKNVAYMVQVKVVNDTATIQRWTKEVKELVTLLWANGEASAPRRVELQKKIDAIRAKIKAARLRKAEASKKTEWVACGWVSE